MTVTRNEQTARQLHLSRGVYPVWFPEPRGIPAEKWQIDVDNRIRYVSWQQIKHNLLIFVQIWSQDGSRFGHH